MKEASEYRQHAQDCRFLAMRMTRDEHRGLLLKMAAAWDRLAAERAELVRRHPELAREGEQLQEMTKERG